MSEQHAPYDTATPPPVSWRFLLDERQRKAIAFAETYVRDFSHGAIGHNDYLLIARLAELLDVAAGVKEPTKPPEPAEIKLTFGKHNGRTLGEVAVIDPGYLDWLSREGRDDAIRRAAAVALLPPSAVEAAEIAAEPKEDLPF